MLSLHLLLLTTGVQSLTPLEEDQLPFQLNVDGYIECYDDLDCPNPVEVAEDNTISQFSCSGKIKSKLCTHFAQGKYILSQLRKTYDSTIQPENTKCARRQSGGTFSSHQKYEFLKQIQLLPRKQQNDRRVWGWKRRGVHWDIWRSYASTGIAWHWWPQHLVPKKVPRMSILLPPGDTMPGAAQRTKGGEVLQTNRTWQGQYRACLSFQMFHLKLFLVTKNLDYDIN